MCGPMLTVRRPTASRARSHGRSSVATTSLGLSRRRSGHPAPVHRPQSDARQCRRPDLIVPFEANLADAADDFEPLVSAPIAAINRELTRASTASGPRIPGQVWNSGSIGAWGKWDANRPPAVGTGRADECVTLTLLGSRGRAGETRLDSPWRRQRARMGAWSAAAVGLSLDSPGAPSTTVGGASARTVGRPSYWMPKSISSSKAARSWISPDFATRAGRDQTSRSSSCAEASTTAVGWASAGARTAPI